MPNHHPMIIRTVSIITLLAFMLTQCVPAYALRQVELSERPAGAVGEVKAELTLLRQGSGGQAGDPSLAPVRPAEQDAADAYEALDAVEALFAAGSLDSLGVTLVSNQSLPFLPQALISAESYSLKPEKLDRSIVYDTAARQYAAAAYKRGIFGGRGKLDTSTLGEPIGLDDTAALKECVFVLFEAKDEPVFNNIDFEREIIKWQLIRDNARDKVEKEDISKYLEELAIALFTQKAGITNLAFDSRFGVKYNGNYVKPEELKAVEAEYNEGTGRFAFKLRLTSASNGHTGRLIEMPFNLGTYEYMAVHPDLPYVRNAPHLLPRKITSPEAELAKIGLLQLIYLERLRMTEDSQQRELIRQRLSDIRQERFDILILGLPYADLSSAEDMLNSSSGSLNLRDLTQFVINDNDDRVLDLARPSDKRLLEFLAYAQADMEGLTLSCRQTEAFFSYHSQIASSRTLPLVDGALRLMRTLEDEYSDISRRIDAIFAKVTELENQREIEAQEAKLAVLHTRIDDIEADLRACEWQDMAELTTRLKQLRSEGADLSLAIELNSRANEDVLLFSDIAHYKAARYCALALAIMTSLALAVPVAGQAYDSSADMLVIAADNIKHFFGNIGTIEGPGRLPSIAYCEEQPSGINPVSEEDERTVVFQCDDPNGGFYIKQAYDEFDGRIWKKSANPHFRQCRFFTSEANEVNVTLNTYGCKKALLPAETGYTVDRNSIRPGDAAPGGPVRYSCVVNKYGETIIEFEGNAPDKIAYRLQPNAPTAGASRQDIPNAFNYRFEVEFPDKVKDMIKEYTGRPYAERLQAARQITAFHKRWFVYDNSEEAQRLYLGAGHDIVNFAYKHKKVNCNIANACNFAALSELGIHCLFAAGYKVAAGRATEADYHAVTFAYNSETGGYEMLDATPPAMDGPGRDWVNTEVLREFLGITQSVAEEMGMPVLDIDLSTVIRYCQSTESSGDSKKALARELVDMDGLLALWERQLERIEKEGLHPDLWLLRSAENSYSGVSQSVFSIVMRIAWELGAYNEVKSKGLIGKTLQVLADAKPRDGDEFDGNIYQMSAEALTTQCGIEEGSDASKQALLNFFIKNFRRGHLPLAGPREFKRMSYSTAATDYLLFEAADYLAAAEVAKSAKLKPLREKAFKKIVEAYGDYSKEDVAVLEGSNRDVLDEASDLMQEICELVRLAYALGTEAELSESKKFKAFFKYASDDILLYMLYPFKRGEFDTYCAVQKYYKDLSSEGALNYALSRGLIKSRRDAVRLARIVFKEANDLTKAPAVEGDHSFKTVVILQTLSVIQTAKGAQISSSLRQRAARLEQAFAVASAQKMDLNKIEGLQALEEILTISLTPILGTKLSDTAIRIYLRKAAELKQIDPVARPYEYFKAYFSAVDAIRYRVEDFYYTASGDKADILAYLYDSHLSGLEALVRMDSYRQNRLHQATKEEARGFGAKAVHLGKTYSLKWLETRFYDHIKYKGFSDLAKRHLEYMVPRLKEIYGRRHHGPGVVNYKGSILSEYTPELLRDHIAGLLDMLELVCLGEDTRLMQVDAPLEFNLHLWAIAERQGHRDFLKSAREAFLRMDKIKPHIEAELEAFTILQQPQDVENVLSGHLGEIDGLPSLLRYNLLGLILKQGELVLPHCKKYIEKTIQDTVDMRLDLNSHAWSMSGLRLTLLDMLLSEDKLIPAGYRERLAEIVLDALTDPGYVAYQPETLVIPLMEILERERSQRALLEDIGLSGVSEYDEAIHRRAAFAARIESALARALPLTSLRMAYLSEGKEGLRKYVKTREFASALKSAAKERRIFSGQKEEAVKARVCVKKQPAGDKPLILPEKTEIDRLKEELDAISEVLDKHDYPRAMNMLMGMLDEIGQADIKKVSSQLRSESAGYPGPGLATIIRLMQRQGYADAETTARLLKAASPFLYTEAGGVNISAHAAGEAAKSARRELATGV